MTDSTFIFSNSSICTWRDNWQYTDNSQQKHHHDGITARHVSYHQQKAKYNQRFKFIPITGKCSSDYETNPAELDHQHSIHTYCSHCWGFNSREWKELCIYVWKSDMWFRLYNFLKLPYECCI